jgi:hypothetical protein
MTARSRPSRSIPLSLSREERWTFHHVLLHRIEREGAEDPATTEPPPIELFRAFETLDSGEIRFTEPQLEAMLEVLAVYQRSPDWEVERAEIERLLHRVSTALETARSEPSR